MCGAAHGQHGVDVANPETAPNGRRVVAVIPEHAVGPAPRSSAVLVQRGGSHPPTRGLPASRSDSRRSDAGQAARPARRKSDGACSRAWLDRWDSDRFAPRRTPRGWNNCPRPPATNQSGRRVRANPGARSGSDPTPPPVANRAGAASTSFPTRTRSCGSICQGMPLRRTNRMPVRHARSETRGRPPVGRGGGVGKNARYGRRRVSGFGGFATCSKALTCMLWRDVDTNFACL